MVQVIGAILACLILKWLFNGDSPIVMLTLPAANTDDLTVFTWELLTSFLLMWVICGAASDPRAVRNSEYFRETVQVYYWSKIKLM